MKKLLVFLLFITSRVYSDEPALPTIFIDTTYRSSTPGTTTHVASGGNVQTAINNAACGDTITFEAGATFSGNFTLPDKDCADDEWVYLISDDLASLPEGVRVTTADISHMPKFTMTSGNIFASASEADHYRLAGLHIEGGAASMFNLVNLSAGETSLTTQARHFIVDRCVILGHTTGNAQRGFLMAGAYISLIDSHVANFKWLGVEAQAVAGWSGSGPWKIVNNYIEGAGQCLLIGGADTTSASLNPADIEIANNDMTKPVSWHPLDPTYAGVGWTVKNTFELKNAKRVLIKGNLFEHTWVSAQDGTAVLFTPRNQNGTAPWVELDDLTIQDNLLRDSGSGYNNLGTDTINSSEDSNRFGYTNNMVIGLSDDWGAAAGQRAFTAFVNMEDLHLRHTTLIHGGAVGTIVTADGAANIGHIAEYNILHYGGAGYNGTGAGCTNVFSVFYVDPVFTDNVCIGITPGGCIDDYENPGVCTNETSVSAVGFVDEGAGNYRLDVTSPYYGAALGGGDIGAWYPSMIAVAQRVNWTHSWEANGTCVDVSFAAPELAVDTSCIVRAGIESVTSTSGALSRTVQVCDLVPDQQYRIMFDCGDTIGGGFNHELYTATSDPPIPPGTTLSKFSFGAPSIVLPTAERMMLQWDDNEGMASPDSEQNNSCGSGCNIDAFLPENSSSWVNWCWKNSSDVILACSKPQQITVN